MCWIILLFSLSLNFNNDFFSPFIEGIIWSFTLLSDTSGSTSPPNQKSLQAFHRHLWTEAIKHLTMWYSLWLQHHAGQWQTLNLTKPSAMAKSYFRSTSENPSRDFQHLLSLSTVCTGRIRMCWAYNCQWHSWEPLGKNQGTNKQCGCHHRSLLQT